MQSPRAKGPLYDPWALSKKLGAEFIGVFLFASVWSFKNQMLSSATAQAVPAGFVLGVTLAVSAAAASARLLELPMAWFLCSTWPSLNADSLLPLSRS